MGGSKLSGLIVSVITPFDAEGNVNVDALCHHVDWLVEQGVHGLLVCAGAGEYFNLSDQERFEITTQAVTTAAGRLPVISYAGHMNRRTMLDLARRLETAGADAVMIAPPLVVRPTQEELLILFQRGGVSSLHRDSALQPPWWNRNEY
jgi:4-hydroxy-tetrahydrodipicolinate synthase